MEKPTKEFYGWTDNCAAGTLDMPGNFARNNWQIEGGEEEYYKALKIWEEAQIPWVSVSDELPKEYKFNMSRDVLTIAGSKMSVKSYDYELGKWSGSPHITVTHWMELPPFSPCK